MKSDNSEYDKGAMAGILFGIAFTVLVELSMVGIYAIINWTWTN